MRPAEPLPPFRKIAAALRRTTERLCREVAAPLDDAPDWNRFEWAVARAVCSLHGISTLLAHRLRWRGPPAWTDFLEEQRTQSIARDVNIDALLADLDAAMRKADLDVVALKGSALRALRLYAPGERPQGDVDLLVEESKLPRLALILETVGYQCAFRMRRHVVFEPREKTCGPQFGEHRANPLKIEVHTRIAEPLPATEVDISSRLAPREPVPGINPYRDNAALMLHLALHAAGNMRAHALRFVQLHDMALLAPRISSAEWDEIGNLPASLGGSWWLAAPLTLVARYHGAVFPDGRLDEWRRRAPRTLRHALDRQSLSDVSWSNLRIHALPGIEWARTPLEALRFARTRIAPSRQARADLAYGVSAMPSIRMTGWYESSQTRRILRWLFGRPARVQTLVSIDACLAAEAGTPGERA